LTWESRTTHGYLFTFDANLVRRTPHIDINFELGFMLDLLMKSRLLSRHLTLPVASWMEIYWQLPQVLRQYPTIQLAVLQGRQVKFMCKLTISHTAVY